MIHVGLLFSQNDGLVVIKGGTEEEAQMSVSRNLQSQACKYNNVWIELIHNY